MLNTNIDIKGKAYEEIVGANLRGDRGEFFTPRNVMKMTVEMVNPKVDEKVLDSSCGTGGFLVTAMTHVIAQLEAEFSEQIGLPQKDWDYDTKKLFQEKISDMAAHNYFGFDINPINNNKYPITSLGGANGLTTSYTCGRFKRIWVMKSEYPIYQPSSVVDIKPTPDGYISKKTKVDIDSLRVHKGQILLTCSGTIGKVSLVSKTLDNAIFSHDLLRIDCKNPVDVGYIYTYLKSKIGSQILITNKYGAVITHIESEHLDTVPIPNAPDTIKSKINDLIIQSYALRDESNALIDQAQALLVKELNLPPISEIKIDTLDKSKSVQTFNVKLSEMAGRADASYHVPIVDAIVDILKKNAAEVTTVGDERISSDIILPGRFKRSIC